MDWKKILAIICLLFTVGILCIFQPISAKASSERQLTGDTRYSTVEDEPGTAQTPEELNKLNTHKNKSNKTVNGFERFSCLNSRFFPVNCIFYGFSIQPSLSAP